MLAFLRKWFRASDKKNRDTKFSQWSQGWRLGAISSLIGVLVVLIINLGLTTWVFSHGPIADGHRSVYAGDCKTAGRINTWLHLLINVLSMALLVGSNFCKLARAPVLGEEQGFINKWEPGMQRLCAPARDEIDAAHKDRKWMNIGVQSLQNLRRIRRKRAIPFLILGISSFPLHLLYNSAVYEQNVVYSWKFFAVFEDVLSNHPVINETVLGQATLRDDPQLSWMKENQDSLERLSVSTCLREYQETFISKRSELLLVLQRRPQDKGNDSVILGVQADPFNRIAGQSWLCSAVDIACNIEQTSIHINEAGVEYCLSKPEEHRCKVRMSLPIMVTILFMNAAKAGCILFALLDGTTTLVTLGDAIASFLGRPDRYTRGYCTLSKYGVEKGRWKGNPAPRFWQTQRLYRREANSWHQWYLSNASACAILVLCILALVKIMRGGPDVYNYGPPPTFKGLWHQNFGDSNDNSVVTSLSVSGFAPNALVANTPQLILTLVYFTYNNLFTCKMVAREWTEFIRKPTTLRVTYPRGQQRSTYYLNLPFRYALPLQAASTILQWLVSQSLFVTSFTSYDYLGNPVISEDTNDVAQSQAIIDQTNLNGNELSQMGFSGMAIFLSIIVGAIIIFAGWIDDLRKYRPGMPHVATCSAAIAAACHPAGRSIRWGEKGRLMAHGDNEHDQIHEEGNLANDVENGDGEDMALKPLMWGIVGMDERTGVAHCAFTTRTEGLRQPEEGELCV